MEEFERMYKFDKSELFEQFKRNGSISLYKVYLSDKSEIPFSDLEEKFRRLAQPANTTKRKLQEETDSETVEAGGRKTESLSRHWTRMELK
eukprot:Nk52_evm39s230 gene=Nk52_evmTU39s230